jgi:quercetin dioxygenase-like cupin family protein
MEAAMANPKFDPNRLPFRACIARIDRAIKAARLKTAGRIITSKDKGIPEVMGKALKVTNVPKGFVKWQLPLYMKQATHLFVSVAEPGAKAPPHSHNDGDGIRFIAGGSITYKGKELTAGDWMYIPAGAKYSFETGPIGAVMFYCYSC